jgi:hypothetical protein
LMRFRSPESHWCKSNQPEPNRWPDSDARSPASWLLYYCRLSTHTPWHTPPSSKLPNLSRPISDAMHPNCQAVIKFQPIHPHDRMKPAPNQPQLPPDPPNFVPFFPSVHRLFLVLFFKSRSIFPDVD